MSKRDAKKQKSMKTSDCTSKSTTDAKDCGTGSKRCK